MVCRKKDTSRPNSSCTRRQLYAPEVVMFQASIDRIQSCPLCILFRPRQGRGNFATGCPFFLKPLCHVLCLRHAINPERAPISTLIDHAAEDRQRNFRPQFGCGHSFTTTRTASGGVDLRQVNIHKVRPQIVRVFGKCNVSQPA